VKEIVKKTVYDIFKSKRKITSEKDIADL